jgi:HPt (histidine-containing phosphotransfer) domain-containing protein
LPDDFVFGGFKMNVATHHLDHDTLQELRAVMGTEFAHLLRTFATDSAMRIDTIERAAAAADADALRHAAHSFKGSSGNMGAKQLSEVCKRIEELARDGELNESAALIPQLRDEYAKVQRELDALLNN